MDIDSMNIDDLRTRLHAVVRLATKMTENNGIGGEWVRECGRDILRAACGD